jgi:nicotinamide-nucleotide amidase
MPPLDDGSIASLAAEVHALLLSSGETVAVAESLTGGALGAALTAVPGVSATFRGGIVAYATELKAELLGVDPDLLARVGPVHELVAAAMASGVKRRLGATYGLSTTGVAGPDPQDGHPPGEVYLGIAGGGPLEVVTRGLYLAGDREAVRAGAVEAALEGLRDLLASGKATR